MPIVNWKVGAITLAGLAIILALGLYKLLPQSQHHPAVAVYPNLIIYNGKIATMDANLTFYQAMAVRGERIWKLGTDKEIRELAGPQTEIIDLRGRTVVPGLIDVHTHPHNWALWHLAAKYDSQLDPVYVDGKDAQDVVRNLSPAVKARIQQIGPGKWLMVAVPHRFFGLLATPIDFDWRPHTSIGLIKREMLDKVSPDNPLVVVSGCCTGFGNTKAKELMIRETGYEHVSRHVLYDTVYGVILRGRTADVASLLTEEMKEFVSYGITTVASHGEANIEVFNALNMMDRQGKMPIRFAWNHESGFFGHQDPAEFYRLYGNIVGLGSEYLWNIGIGWEVWDSFGDCLSIKPKTKFPQLVLQEWFLSPPGPCIPSGSKSYRGILAASKGGLRIVGLHNITGDRVLDRAFNLAEDAIRSRAVTLEQISKQRWGFDHNWWVRPDQIPLIKKYGFWLNFQAQHFSLAIPYVLNNFGEQYLRWVMPLKSLADAGVPIVFGTDVHIGKLNDNQEKFFNDLGATFPYRDSVWPWVGIWVTRELNGRVWQPEEKIDRITALKGWTSEAAKYVLREKDLGTLEPGNLADFVVIDKDYFTIPDKEIMNLKTLMTVLSGEIVYKAQNF